MTSCLFSFLYSFFHVLHRFRHLVNYISAVHFPGFFGELSNNHRYSQQVIYYLPHIIFESVVRSKLPLNSTSEINCHASPEYRTRDHGLDLM